MRIVYVLYDVGGIQQDHDVVREKADGIDAELFFGKQYCAGLSHAEQKSYDRNVDTPSVGLTREVFWLSVAGTFGNRRTDPFRARKSFPRKSINMSKTIGYYLPAELFQSCDKPLLDVQRCAERNAGTAGSSRGVA